MNDIVEKLMNIPDIKETEGQKNPTAHLKFQNVLGRGTWYVIEMGAMDSEEPDVLLFGYVVSPLDELYDEWGYFTLGELIQTGVIILDPKFKPQPIGELIPKAVIM